MRAIQGALIIASTIQIILGFSGLWRNAARLALNLTKFYDCHQIVTLFFFFRLLSPLSAVPLVALAGLGLYEFGFPGVSTSYL